MAGLISPFWRIRKKIGHRENKKKKKYHAIEAALSYNHYQPAKLTYHFAELSSPVVFDAFPNFLMLHAFLV